MDAETLRASLAPNLPPDSVSWWPLGIGWVVIILLIVLGLCAWLAWYSWHTPWWRWPAVRRWQASYLAELATLSNTAKAAAQEKHPDPTDASAFNHALSQWLRRLMRDGLGVAPTLPPGRFHQACLERSPVALPPGLPQLLDRVYSPYPAYDLLLAEEENLIELCQTCLNLHSPGPG